MNVTVFLMIVAFIAISQVIILYLSLRQVSTVKAGNVLKYSPAKKWRVGSKPQHIRINGTYVDVRNMEQLIVCGNSMQDYQISNGQTVFVSLYDGNGRESITTHPVVVFHITDASAVQSQYKLRKMVSYADGYTQNWGAIYDANESRIRIAKSAFEEMCVAKVKKMQDEGIADERLIVSETYDEDLRAYRYSLHPVSTLYAKVRYVV